MKRAQYIFGVVALSLGLIAGLFSAGYRELLFGVSLFMTAITAGVFSGAISFTALQRVVGAKWSKKIELAAFDSNLLIFGIIWIIPQLILAWIDIYINFPVTDGPTNSELFAPAANSLLYLWILLVGLYYIQKFKILNNKSSKTAPALILIAYLFIITGFAYTLNSVSGLTPGGTLFGMYYGLSCYTAFLSAFTISILRKTDTHKRQDLMKLLFAANCLWAYFLLMQYIIIHYQSIPAEITFYTRRSDVLFWLAGAVHFLVPFIMLLPEKSKQSVNLSLIAAILIFAGSILENIWLWVPAVKINLKFFIITIPLLLIYLPLYFFRKKKSIGRE